MVLVDTSVWVAHLRHGTIGLEVLLNEGRAFCHPFIIGELACGNLQNRSKILVYLQALPQANLADHKEVCSLSKIMASWEKVWGTLISIYWPRLG